MARVRVCFWVDLEPVPPTKQPTGIKGSDTNPFLGFDAVNIEDIRNKAIFEHRQYASLISKK